uniref:Uncharacterized protein n=1 Tax=uncultured Desulfobacterium sp. TaxID=201089 RepID=E1Y8N1_9BACT|nr:unknown protein [uncultured Desulfobacterium sp.]
MVCHFIFVYVFPVHNAKISFSPCKINLIVVSTQVKPMFLKA